MYRIISFDGGGIRGLLSLHILLRLVEHKPGLLDVSNLVAGTSTGGIISLWLAAGKPLDGIISLYEKRGKEIFSDSIWDNLKDLGNVLGAKYDNAQLKEILISEFGETSLGELGKKVLIPSFRLDSRDKNQADRRWKPKFFHNFKGPHSCGQSSVVDVALSTSAAPTYFPSYDGMIDGGVVANNPTLCAVVQTQDPRNEEAHPNLTDVSVLSIGTGTVLRRISGTSHDWGLAKWAPHLVNLMFDASIGAVDFQCAQLLNKYHRISPTFTPGEDVPLDCWKKADKLRQTAEELDLSATKVWLDQNW